MATAWCWLADGPRKKHAAGRCCCSDCGSWRKNRAPLRPHIELRWNAFRRRPLSRSPIATAVEDREAGAASKSTGKTAGRESAPGRTSRTARGATAGRASGALCRAAGQPWRMPAAFNSRRSLIPPHFRSSNCPGLPDHQRQVPPDQLMPAFWRGAARCTAHAGRARGDICRICRSAAPPCAPSRRYRDNARGSGRGSLLSARP